MLMFTAIVNGYGSKKPITFAHYPPEKVTTKLQLIKSLFFGGDIHSTPAELCSTSYYFEGGHYYYKEHIYEVFFIDTEKGVVEEVKSELDAFQEYVETFDKIYQKLDHISDEQFKGKVRSTLDASYKDPSVDLLFDLYKVVEEKVKQETLVRKREQLEQLKRELGEDYEY